MEKRVRIFDNFKEADEADAKEYAEMSPQDKVNIVLELRNRHNPDALEQGLARVYRVIKLKRS